MPRPASDLTSHLGYWLRYVSNHVSHAFARKLTGDAHVAEDLVFEPGLHHVDRDLARAKPGKPQLLRGDVVDDRSGDLRRPVFLGSGARLGP